ncbi:MAG: hypothetical protein DRP58_02260 [Spirochaetes bacterium]|nr:MAG: hypothetical protein DRP58_02260 [Spirochaetota bacterium]
MAIFIRFKLFVIVILLFFLLACSGSVPEIGQVVWQLNFSKSPVESQVYQNLSVFLLIDDADGLSDIDFIYIIHDESELFWILSPETWVEKVISGKNWIGSNNISMNDKSDLPSGKYRILVLDKAGERDSQQINISKKITILKDGLSFPELIIGSDIKIKSVFSDNTLWIYDKSMVLLKNIKIKNGQISKSIILDDTNNAAHWISIYSFSPETGTGLVRGPYLIQG